jgi:hypothetical protein
VWVGREGEIFREGEREREKVNIFSISAKKLLFSMCASTNNLTVKKHPLKKLLFIFKSSKPIDFQHNFTRHLLFTKKYLRLYEYAP